MKRHHWGLLALGTLVTSISGLDVQAQPPAANCGAQPTEQNCSTPAYLQACPAQKPTCDNINAVRTYKADPRSKANRVFDQPSGAFIDTKVQPNYGVSSNPTIKPASPRLTTLGNVPVQTLARAVTQHHWGAIESKARMDALTAAGQAADHIRAGISAGFGVSTCEEYVYKRYYDHERWLDAVGACKGDDQCVVNVSLLPQTPGIARRSLKSKEPAPRDLGPASAADQVWLDQYDFNGLLPKNAFYAGTGYFLTDSIVQAFAADATKSASVRALVQTVRAGLSTYRIGAGSGGASMGATAQGFSDEWDFHKVLNQRTQGASHGEFTEYARRDKNMLGWMGRYFTDAKCATAQGLDRNSNMAECGPNVPNAVGQVGPGQKVEAGDPFVMRAIFGNVDRANSTNMAGFFKANPTVAGQVFARSHVVSGLSFPGLAGGMAGRVGATPMLHRQPISPAVDNSQSNYLQSKWAQFPPAIDTSSPYPRLACGGAAPGGLVAHRYSVAKYSTATVTAERFQGESAACQATNALLDEWAKASAPGGDSCLNPNKAACDWSPKMFTDRWVTNFLGYGGNDKEALYASCKDWKSFVLPKANVLAVETEIKKQVAARAKLLADIGVKEKNVFGEDRNNTEKWGNSDFGVGYEYDYGWETRIFDPRAANTHKPCHFGARLDGKFNAFAYAFGPKHFKIVEVGFALDDNDNEQHVQTQIGHATGHAFVMGNAYELFNFDRSVPINTLTTLAEKLPTGGSSTLVVVPIPVGPFTVTLKLGVAFGYGASVTAKVEAPPKATCIASPALGVKVGVEPSAHLDLLASAEFGILGGLLGAGVDVDVTLLKAALPLTAEIKMTNPASPTLNFDLSLDLQLSTLGGSLSAYVEALWIKWAEFQIVSWKGLTFKVPLFHTKAVPIPLAKLEADFEPLHDTNH